MESKLLVRAYNVGFGDCIYVRIPSRHGGFHILIDCGTLGSIKLLRQAIEHLKKVRYLTVYIWMAKPGFVDNVVVTKTADPAMNF